MGPMARSRLPRRLNPLLKIPAAAAGLLALAGCSPAGLLTGLDRLLAPSEATKVAKGVAYGPLDRQKLDIWAPRERSAELRPVVVFLYGGGWVEGERSDYGFAGAAYADEGFITVVPDYRQVPSVQFPAFVQDSARAVKWASENIGRYGGDPNRITLAGHSAGAYNAAMIALDPRFLEEAGAEPGLVRAAALLSGPTDFYPFTEKRGRDALGNWPRPAETQPITFARAGAPPLFLAHGTSDEIVQPRNSVVLAQRLNQLGAPVELRLYEGASHVDVIKSLAHPFRGTTPVLEQSAEFLRRHSLAKGESLRQGAR